jgi:hypothetical protein
LRRLTITILGIALVAVAGCGPNSGSSMSACERVLRPALANNAPGSAPHYAYLSPACKGLTQTQQVKATDIVLGIN